MLGRHSSEALSSAFVVALLTSITVWQLVIVLVVVIISALSRPPLFVNTGVRAYLGRLR